MKKERNKLEVYIVLTVFVIIIFASLVSAGWIEWIKKITGKAAVAGFNVSVSISGTSAMNITVYNASLDATGTTPVEYPINLSLEINISIHDPDGVNDINDSSVTMNFTHSANPELGNETGCLQTANNETDQNYTCSIEMMYWYEPGTYTIKVTANDLGNGTYFPNTDTTFFYGTLQALILEPDNIYWDPLTPGATNQIPPAGNFTMIKNTGNFNLSGNISINGTDLSDGSNTFDVENFTADVDEGAAACTGGINLSHSTNVTIQDIVLSQGDLSTGIQGNASIYYCIPEVPTSLPSGAYSTLTAGTWWEIKIEAN